MRNSGRWASFSPREEPQLRLKKSSEAEGRPHRLLFDAAEAAPLREAQLLHEPFAVRKLEPGATAERIEP